MTSSPRPDEPATGAGLAPAIAALLVLAGIGALGAYAPTPYRSPCGPTVASVAARTPIQHVFVIIKENHAFENYFGTLPGVTGYPPNGSFPTSLNGSGSVSPFPLNATSTPDLPHDHASEVVDQDSGRNDRFVAEAASEGYPAPQDAVGYYTAAEIPQYYDYATEYAIADHFFSGYLGPTNPNRDFDLSASTDGQTNDLEPPAGTFTNLTILDQLSAAGVPWAYDYTGNPQNLTPFEFVGIQDHPCEAAAVVPMGELAGQIDGPYPPSVVFLDPSHDADGISEHPPDNVSRGANWTTAVINAILSSPIGPSSAVLLFYDEAGGFWDPVVPPIVDGTSDGFRIPLLVISDYTPRGLVIHATLDPASVLAFLDANWGLAPLNARVGGAPGLAAFFDFSAPPRAPQILPTSYDLSAPYAPAGGGPGGDAGPAAGEP